MPIPQQLTIQIGDSPNDGDGDPLRTAFTKCNQNFSNLWNSTGVAGIANGTSNILVANSGSISVTSAGTANVLVVTNTGATVNGTLTANTAVSATGTVTAANVVCNGVVTSTGNVLGGNLSTAGQVSAAGNITGNVLIATGSFVVIPVAAGDPAGPVTGAMYFNSVSGNLRIWTGSTWVSK